MSVAGFDVGDQASCVAVARKRGIDVLLNKESKRETPSVVAFGPKQRQMGTDAVGSLNISPKNAVTSLKRLLGKKFSSPAVQQAIAGLPFAVRQGEHDSVLVDVQYLGEKATFSPEQLLAMLIVDLSAIADADASPVTDCVISVPVYFTEAERNAVLAAAKIANVNCLRLLNETTAVALAYGIYRTDLPEATPTNVAFVDIGASGMQVSVVAFKKGQLQVLSHAWDCEVGGRLFDEVLFEHFAKEFGDKHNINIKSNARASYRLRTACEKMKKVLSANADASLSVESIMEDVDVRGKMSRADFEAMSAPILDRVRGPLQQALADAKLSAGDLAAVELVGSSSRVPALLAILTEVLGQEPGRTQNAKEAVSKGCALCCAMLSPIFKVRDFQLIDASPFGFSFTWEKDGQPFTNTIFERGCPLPNSKVVTTFKPASDQGAGVLHGVGLIVRAGELGFMAPMPVRTSSFEVTAQYTPDSNIPEGFDRALGRFTVKAPSCSGGDRLKLKLKLRLNLNGCAGLEEVQNAVEEEYDDKVPRPAKAQEPAADTPMPEARTTADGDVAQAAETSGDAAMEEAPGQSEATPMDAEPSPAGKAAADKAKPAQPEFDIVRKKRTKLVGVPFQALPAGGVPSQKLQVMIERENELASQMRLQEATNDRKNALEAYVYALRGKLSGPLEPYVTPADRDSIMAKLTETEDWLYEDGEDETKAVYVAKLEELQKLGGPIELRAAEEVARGPAGQALQNTAAHYLGIVQGSEAKYSHLSKEDRDKVVAECSSALQWLQDKQQLQAQLRPTDDPVLVHTDINKKNETLSRVCHPITSKPAPPPPAEKKAAKEEKTGKDGKPAEVPEPNSQPEIIVEEENGNADGMQE